MSDDNHDQKNVAWADIVELFEDTAPNFPGDDRPVTQCFRIPDDTEIVRWLVDTIMQEDRYRHGWNPLKCWRDTEKLLVKVEERLDDVCFLNASSDPEIKETRVHFSRGSDVFDVTDTTFPRAVSLVLATAYKKLGGMKVFESNEVERVSVEITRTRQDGTETRIKDELEVKTPDDEAYIGCLMGTICDLMGLGPKSLIAAYFVLELMEEHVDFLVPNELQTKLFDVAGEVQEAWHNALREE